MKDPAENLKLLPATRARELLGGISTTTLWRYERDADLGFPRAIEIRKRKFFRASELAEWIAARSDGRPEAA